MTRRVFKSAAEAEAAGFKVFAASPYPTPPTFAHRTVPGAEGIDREVEQAVIRTPLETQLYEALELAEWSGATNIGVWPRCPRCRGAKALGHTNDCEIGGALKAFRGEDGP